MRRSDCLFLIVAIADIFLGMYLISNSSPNNPNPWQGYDSWWQDAQDAKMYECYQREPSMKKVTDCLLKHNVFI